MGFCRARGIRAAHPRSGPPPVQVRPPVRSSGARSLAGLRPASGPAGSATEPPWPRWGPSSSAPGRRREPRRSATGTRVCGGASPGGGGFPGGGVSPGAAAGVPRRRVAGAGCTRARSSSCRAMNSAADPARAAWAASGSRAYPGSGVIPRRAARRARNSLRVLERPVDCTAQLCTIFSPPGTPARPVAARLVPARLVPARLVLTRQAPGLLVPGRTAVMHPHVVDQIHLGHRGPRHLVHPQRVHHGDARGVGHDAGAQRARVHDPGDRDDHGRRNQRGMVTVAQRQHDQQHDRERHPRPPRHQGSAGPVDLPLAGQIRPRKHRHCAPCHQDWPPCADRVARTR